MNKLFENFPKSSKEDWIQVLTKELKGADFESSLIKNDEIEELHYPAFYHKEDSTLSVETPGVFPYKRGFFSELNDWSIVGEVLVSDAKTANQKALDLLMKGNSALHFEFSEQQVDLNTLFAGIEFEYIKTFITCSDSSTFVALNTFFEGKKCGELFLNYNPLAASGSLKKEDLFSNTTQGITRNFEVDAYSIQQAGANCAQEIAFSLHLGHSYLFQQTQVGRSVDDSLLNIHFTFGIGSTYLFEIAKLRAFRLLWSKIARSYSPEHRCNETAQITSKTGFLNKSLQDPYTNLLRQTTEVMSAVLGGANHIINQAYDKNSTHGASELAERMATNISLILKEESYLEKVLDAVGGSYAIESLTENLADKAWSIFQEIENSGNLNTLRKQIKTTASKRVDLHREKKKTLIGITKFPNPDTSNLKWKTSELAYFGLKQIVIEEEVTTLIPN
jgi:methylmalonyl-CoA mutase